jgi:hypothetical protein
MTAVGETAYADGDRTWRDSREDAAREAQINPNIGNCRLGRRNPGG